jgi:hypothetical protein
MDLRGWIVIDSHLLKDVVKRWKTLGGKEAMRICARRTTLLVLLGLALSALVRGQEYAGIRHPDTAGWKNLFEPDLSNAIFSPGGWIIQDGVLVAKTGETIWTKESYGNFVLDLEFKVAKNANSGVFLRTGDIKNILSALEIQVHETNDGAQYGMVGALYNAKPPSRDMAKPVGQWNRYTITCQDSRLMLVFNGEQVIDIDLNDWKEANKNPDGTKNKFSVALKDYARIGPIGLQGLHGAEAAPVWFRNLKVKVVK